MRKIKIKKVQKPEIVYFPNVEMPIILKPEIEFPPIISEIKMLEEP
jgi:hypothetical protein